MKRNQLGKKLAVVAMATTMLASVLTGCGAGASSIAVVSREDGSGTRGAFVELVGVEEKDANGEKVDKTTDQAEIVNSTSVVMTTVAGNPDAIGYISLGSLDDTIKALKVDGTEATMENVTNGSYTIARPFNIATKEGLSEAATDFINYILSADGQAIIEENGYVKASDAGAFTSTGVEGKVVIAGSSSVSPVMQKLVEAYGKVNDKVEIELQTSDSTTGMTSAMDGIAVIVNKDNAIEDITTDQIKSIYVGEVTSWDDIAN